MRKESFNVVYKRNYAEYNIEVCEDLHCWDDIVDEVTSKHNLLNVNDVIGEDFEFHITDFDISELPDFIVKYIGGDTRLWDELFSVYYDTSFYYDLEVLEAGIDCDIDLESINEAYNGEYSCDADFAEQTVNDCYGIKLEPSWLVVDWEQTAVNLMYDFTESNGHYFNNNY